MDEERKRDLKRAYRAQEHAAARTAMTLDEGLLVRLLDHLDAGLTTGACDHTLRLTRAWAAENGVDADALAGSVAQFGGYCDCEVLANVDPEAIF